MIFFLVDNNGAIIDARDMLQAEADDLNANQNMGGAKWYSDAEYSMIYDETDYE